MNVRKEHKLSPAMEKALLKFLANPKAGLRIDARTHVGLRNRGLVEGCVIHVGSKNLTTTTLTDKGFEVMLKLTDF